MLPTSFVTPRQLEAVLQVVREVRFEQAAEAAESVHWKPPKAAIGGNGSNSDGFRRTENFSAEVGRPHRSLDIIGIQFVMFVLFRSRWAAAVVSTGPAGAQSLPCRRVGSGVGAESAPTPFAAPNQSWP